MVQTVLSYRSDLFYMRQVFFLITVFILLVSFGCKEADTPPFHDRAFVPILSKENINDWVGDPDHWEFEDGILIGESTPNNILIENTFFIWKEKTGKNFELKLKYRISERGNSGINYRSTKMDGKPYMLQGYQADIDGKNVYTGQLYEEKGRSILTKKGQLVHIYSDNDSSLVAEIGRKENQDSIIDSTQGAWNNYHVIAFENTLIHLINGHITSITLDDGNKKNNGQNLGLQLHLGPPMKVEFKEIKLKRM